MSPLVLAILTMVALGAGAFAFAPTLLGGGRADKRVKALKGDQQRGKQASAADRLQKKKQERRKSLQQLLDDEKNKNKARTSANLQQRIFQSGVKMTKGAYIRNCVIVGAVTFVIMFFIDVPPIFALVFGSAAGYLIPRWHLKRRTNKFQAKFLEEFPNAIEAIVRGVRSGLPLNDSIRVVADDAKEPVKSEFSRILDQQAVGKSIGESVGVLFERLPIPEVNFFVVVITVQQQAGGNLSEALGNLANVLRERKKMKAKVKALASEANASAMIIGSLPFLVGGLVSLVSPAYMTPLFATDIGKLWLAVAAAMMSMGIFVMRKMVKFDV